MAGPGRTTRAQDEVVNFRKPILVVETRGHHAPVRGLVWQNPFSILSGGHDKVVKEWDFRDGARLVRSLRPMIWRGQAGVIYDLALSPRPDAQGQSLLAVAGYGVESRRGDITVFRVPGTSPSPTGEVVARLLPPRDGQPVGHHDSVLCLAFDPAGRVLASGGNNLDPNVILWDATRTVRVGGATTFPPLRVLAGHSRAIRRLAFLPPDGSQLVTASEDGTLRVWDVARGVELARSPSNPLRPVVINALAVSPDGASIVVGRENGDIYAFEARDVARIAPTRLPTLATQGSVESLAFHPDGRRLAATLRSDKPDVIDPRTVACDLEIRELPGGRVTHRRRVPGLLYDCAFSPDGLRLAYSGGMTQAIVVQELADLDRPPIELKGLGSTLFDLGFGPDDRVIGFTREFDPTRPPAIYEAFDPARRRATTVPRADLRGSLSLYDGWSLRGNVNRYVLEAVNTDGRRWRADIDANRERLWWSHTMIPPGPGHPRATLAVGCETGVVIYDLETGRRTRMFAAGSGAVVSVVPSRDGHWLAASSLDQTVTVHPLAGCDTRSGLDARFRRGEDGGWGVTLVEPHGFAAGMGLRVGDLVVESGTVTRTTDAAGVVAFAKRDFKTADELGVFLNGFADQVAPNDAIGIRVRRTAWSPYLGPVPFVEALPTTKRDIPAFVLMLDVSREWVFWTPQGYYDTSIEGDGRLLGWHINPQYDQTRPTDFVPVGTFPALYRPDILERLWTSRSLDRAMATVAPVSKAPDEVVAAEPPPRIAVAPSGEGIRALASGVWESTVPRPRVRLAIAAAGTEPLGERRIVLDERVLRAARGIGPGTDYQEEVELELPPGRRVRLLVTATNRQNASRTVAIDLEYRAPAPTASPARRVVVLGIGTDAFRDGTLPAVPFAERDASSLAGFLSDHLVAGDGARPAGSTHEAPVVKVGAVATVKSTRDAFEHLVGLTRKGELKKGDVVAVVVASHVLELKPGEPLKLAVSDTRLAEPDGWIPARELSEICGQLTDYGCRVVVLLDGVHDGPLPREARADVKAWVRDLQQRRGVITFVAAKEGPNGVAARERHGLFALGVLNAFRAARAAGVPSRGARPLTFEQFLAAVERQVLDLSDRQQEVGGFLPPEVAPWTPFALP